MLRQYLQKIAASKVLGPEKIKLALQSLPGWNYVTSLFVNHLQAHGKLHKNFTFSTYEDASFFINRYTSQCVRLSHTPEWKNVYNQVEITITTTVHEADSVSVKDIQLARYLERVGSIDLGVTSLLDYYSHKNISLDVKKLYNNQDVPTKGKRKECQLGLNYEGLIYGEQLRIEGKQERRVESILYEEDEGVEAMVAQLHNVAYDRYNSKGKERIAQLTKREYEKERDYDSEEYVSDGEEAKIKESEDLRLEYKE